MSDRDKTLLDMKMNLNSMMKMCFISAVIVELFLNFGLFSGICNNKDIFSFLNLCYWIMAIVLLFPIKGLSVLSLLHWDCLNVLYVVIILLFSILTKL